MIYLESFRFTSTEQEQAFFDGIMHTCYDTFYPYQILEPKGVKNLEFAPITILYGGNGSGKTTALNVIAEKLKINRDSRYNRSNFFEKYLAGCEYRTAKTIPEESRIITSDDVFDYMLDIRTLNEGIDVKREELFEEWYTDKYSDFHFKTMEDYDRLKKVNLSRRKSQSQYTRARLMDNVKENSNGENAFMYFTQKIEENALYLLDEPENSLSPERQQELSEFIYNSTRFFGCQIIMATHSPFLLAMKGARIYDFDDGGKTKEWTELSNVRAYFDFFKKHENEFNM